MTIVNHPPTNYALEQRRPPSKSSKSGPEKLHREPEFLQGAWEELRPYMMELGAALVELWGYEASASSEVDDVFLRLTKAADGKADIAVILPSRLEKFGIYNPTLRSSGILLAGQAADFSVVEAKDTAPAQIVPAPVLELVHIIQCFFPGDFATPPPQFESYNADGQPKSGRAVPTVAWLLRREMILREAFGCTYFRYLLDAARTT